VSGLHPPGITRPPEANLRGRRSVFLSEGDLSGAVARQRRAPALVNDMVVSTYEPTPDYPNYEPNRITLEGLGVPILNSMDISNIDDTAQRLSGIGHGANIHFQMPRVPRIPGYSTQQLIRHTLSLPSTMDREDLSVSITAPHPEMYGLPGTHNRIYGLENSNAVVGTNMERYEAATDSDEELEEFGYEHKESTKNKSAEAAKKRKKYKFQTLGNEHSNIKRDPGAPPPDDDNVGETLAPD
jgi:hypothetical protein